MPPPKLVHPKKLAKMVAEDAAKSIAEATGWFAETETMQAIKEGLPKTTEFLLANESRMNSVGDIEDMYRWFDNSSYQKTNQWLLINGRKSALRRLTYGHGVMYLLKHLNRKKILSNTTVAHWDRATNLAEFQASEVLLGKMLRHSDTDSKEAYLNLEGLMPFFGYVYKTNSVLVRNKWVVPMVNLGLWSASQVKGEYQVCIGPLGKLFFDKVFEPVVKAYDAILDSDDPSATGPIFDTNGNDMVGRAPS